MSKLSLAMPCLFVALSLSACGRADDDGAKQDPTRARESIADEGTTTDVSQLESARNSADACAKTNSAPEAGSAAPECKDQIVVDGSDPKTHHPGLVFPE